MTPRNFQLIVGARAEARQADVVAIGWFGEKFGRTKHLQSLDTYLELPKMRRDAAAARVGAMLAARARQNARG